MDDLRQSRKRVFLSAPSRYPIRRHFICKTRASQLTKPNNAANTPGTNSRYKPTNETPMKHLSKTVTMLYKNNAMRNQNHLYILKLQTLDAHLMII